MPILFRLPTLLVFSIVLNGLVAANASACGSESATAQTADERPVVIVSQDLSRLFDLVEREA